MKKALLLTTCFLGFAGLFLVLADAYFMTRYGLDFLSIDLLTASGEAAEYPSGTKPYWRMIPAWAYALPLWFFAGILQLAFNDGGRDKESVCRAKLPVGSKI